MEQAIPEDEIKKKQKNKDSKPKSKMKMGRLKSVLDGSVLTSDYVTKQIPFVFFLAMLAMFYIGNSYRAKKIEKQIKQKVRQVEELDAEYISLTSDLIYKSRRSSVETICFEMGIGLMEANEPPMIIEVKK